MTPSTNTNAPGGDGGAQLKRSLSGDQYTKYSTTWTYNHKDIIYASLNIKQLIEKAHSMPEPETVVGPFKRGNLILVHALTGVGKTQFSVELAVTAACGGEVFGRWSAPKPCYVVYLDGEMGARIMGIDRFETAMMRARPLDDPDRLRIVTYDMIMNAGCPIPDLSNPEDQETLDILVAATDFVIIDNLSSLMKSGVENEAESWGLFNAWLLKQRARGRTVLIVHHSGKNGDQRGTSRRLDNLDFVIKLTRPLEYNASDGARFNIEFEKARGIVGELVEPFETWLRPDPENPLRSFWYTDDSENQSLMRRIVKVYTRDQVHSPTAIAEILDTNKGTVSRYLKKAKEKNLIGAPIND